MSNNGTICEEQKDSFISETIVNSTYWTQWGPLSTVSEFAEIKFVDNHTFFYERGTEYRCKAKRDTIIHESYSGIWYIKDSIITMSHLSDFLGTIENKVKIVNYKELMIIHFDNVLNYTKTFRRKPFMSRNKNF
jgi:hypothetical protein